MSFEMQIRWWCGAALLMVLGPAWAWGQTVTIRLEPEVQLAGGGARIVRLREVATIQGGPPQLRSQLERLDIATTDPAALVHQVRRQQILARIMLAGIDTGKVLFVGATSVNLRWQNRASTRSLIEEAITRKVSKAFNIDQANVQVEISDSLETLDAAVQAALHAKVVVLDPARNLLGRRPVEVGIEDGTQIVYRERIAVDVAMYLNTLVTSRPIRKGELLGQDNTYADRIRVTGFGQLVPDKDALIGQPVRRDLRAQQIIQRRDLATVNHSNAGATEAPTVQRRDRISVIIRGRNSRITLHGAEVVEGGRVGDVIHVKNPKSGKVLYAKLIDSSYAELIR